MGGSKISDRRTKTRPRATRPTGDIGESTSIYFPTVWSTIRSRFHLGYFLVPDNTCTISCFSTYMVLDYKIIIVET
jgi:hypothetical protein